MASGKLSVSVLVPCLMRSPDHVAMTIRCIDAAKRTNRKAEWVCVETGTDYVKDKFDVHIYEKDKTNVTASINRGIRCCCGDIIVLLTNDVFVEPNWLDALLECFKLKDCGIATIGTSQLGNIKEDVIEEGIWFPISGFLKKDIERYRYFDERYHGIWSDTDFIMWTYLNGMKSYRNRASIATHQNAATEGADINRTEWFDIGRRLFETKYEKYKTTLIYKILTEGIII